MAQSECVDDAKADTGQLQSIVVALFDGVQLLDVAGPVDVLQQVAQYQPASGGYVCTYYSVDGEIRASNGMTIRTRKFAELHKQPVDILLVPGADSQFIVSAIGTPDYMAHVRRLSQRAKRSVSICTGAFVLAALGLLKGKRATTHWKGLEVLSTMDKSIEVHPDDMYVIDGSIWTSAGIAAGMDLALAMVRQDFGPDVALSVARDLIIPYARTTGQVSYLEDRQNLKPASKNLEEVLHYIRSNLSADLAVEKLADISNLSLRSFHRECKKHFGMSPGNLVREQRLEHVRALLINSSMPLKEVAARCGYASESALAKAFKSRFNQSPRTFRVGMTAYKSPGRV